MLYQPSTLAVIVFFAFVGVTLGLSFWLGRKAKSSAGYFAAHGEIPWFVNGVAFAGDYLSAASFLGICGMIAFYGYDGFLYSIGYLAGWIVALFVIAEPMKRLGKFTFADALDAKFGSRGIKLAAGVSTLVVSLFYLIPQMVGAGTLVKPLLGLPHWAGVVMVGAVVILIVTTAGMVSTTWVQFIKGALLVVLCSALTAMILVRGHRSDLPVDGEPKSRWFRTTALSSTDQTVFEENVRWPVTANSVQPLPATGAWADKPYARLPLADGRILVLRLSPDGKQVGVCQTSFVKDGVKFVNGRPQQLGEVDKATGKWDDTQKNDFDPVGEIVLPDSSKPVEAFLSPTAYISTLAKSDVVTWSKDKIVEEGTELTIFYPTLRKGEDVLVPGGSPTFAGIRSDELTNKLDFISLMLALFAGTASLPHILIRYYTVKDAHAARLSTVVGIFTIGFFYILTLYLGLAAMTSRVLDPTDSNMAAPLLAKSFGEFMFAAISAVAFTTVLGTVSGLILAASGAVAHDLLAHGFGVQMSDHEKIRIAKITAVVVGLVGIGLGIVFKDFNVTFLVGWAFNIAASANLPALVMLLFWPRTTKQGIIASVLVGMLSSLTWVLLSGPAMVNLYGMKATDALVPFSQPGLVTIPLGFATLVLVSLMTQPKHTTAAAA
ncbi:Cation/acetate symporter ActP [Caulifigura coniformis]|uniref:Cation/acetate symporter ActP n=1 Tax=Caulifigura coniformis TaxID=2527983 RepID=A0A517SA28_9PLAN|nr:cation acetate symporter [Caulifigura coniformis]QDT52972.1 Cation/acetate symporter ActP [Caulifigura coniformis]